MNTSRQRSARILMCDICDATFEHVTGPTQHCSDIPPTREVQDLATKQGWFFIPRRVACCPVHAQEGRAYQTSFQTWSKGHTRVCKPAYAKANRARELMLTDLREWEHKHPKPLWK